MILLAVAGGMFAWSSYADRRYLARLNAEIARLDPLAQRAAALDRQVGKTRAQTELLDRFRAQTRLDLDALNELTRIIVPPAWTSAINLNRDTARITGEAPDAAPLVEDPRFLAVLRKLRPRLHQPRRQRRRRRDVPDPHLAGERQMKGDYRPPPADRARRAGHRRNRAPGALFRR